MKPDQETIRRLLDYDPETGIFVWKAPRRNVRVGDVAGCKHSSGYILIGVFYRLYKAHRLAWLHTYGEWPTNQLDHVNGVRDDNRIANLRAADARTNGENHRRPHHDNLTGFLGVSPYKGRYRAQISVGGKNRPLGTFDTAPEAHQAYLAAKRQHHSGNTL